MSVQHEISRLRRNSEAAWRRFDFETSAELLRQAHKLSPQDPRLLLDLGYQSGLRYDYNQAREYFEKAIRVSGWQTAAFVAAGAHCISFSQPTMAQDYFERALKKQPDSAEVLVLLAEVYERFGHLDAAEGLVTRATGIAPGNVLGQLLQAKVWRRQKRVLEAEVVLREVAGRAHPDLWAVAQVWYELGLNLDVQARYDEAMAAFLEAKKLLLPPTEKAYEAHQQSQQERQVEYAALTGETWKKFRAEGANLPPARRMAFLVGHPRSGTTLLEQVLDAHPAAVSLEETRIFHESSSALLSRVKKESGQPDWLANLVTAQLPPVRENYFAQAEKFLGQPVGGRLLIDKNPSLTVSVSQIASIFPEAKFLVALRDPRDVCLSCFMQPLPPAVVNTAYLTLERAVHEYASLMGLWLASRDQMAAPWLEVRYEDTVVDLAATARRALHFLELPWDERVLGFHEHAQAKLVRSPTYADVGKPIYKTSLGRWQHYQKYLEPHLDRLKPFIKAFGYE